MEYNKTNPFNSKLTNRTLLNKEGSSKATYHVTLDIEGSNITYSPGDAVCILPMNNPEEVDLILQNLNLLEESELREHLLKKTNLNRVTAPLYKHAFLEDDKHIRPNMDLLEFSKRAKKESILIDKETLLANTSSLLPRFYSIASAQSAAPNQIDLLVATFSYTHAGVTKSGVGSNFLCNGEHNEIPLYIHKAPHFQLPENPDTTIIMIGPGTGLAPYRGFLQERLATGATGKNILFFGERNRKTDFYYEEFLTSYPNLHLETAFSRDQNEKIYVQDKLLENSELLWNEIKNGAIIYICGDAKRMAKSVTSALESIIEKQGQVEPKPFIKELRKSKRLRMDVY